MKIWKVFERDISLTQAHVIFAEAQDISVLSLEYNNYMYTPAVIQGLTIFFQQFFTHTQSYGVWISGYFGVGKSHLLKTLYQVMQLGKPLPHDLQRFSKNLKNFSTECVLLNICHKKNNNLETALIDSLKNLDPNLDTTGGGISGLDSYFARKPVGHRLIFLIDEVWQYALTHESWATELKNLVNQIRSRENLNVVLIVTSQWGFEAIQEHFGKESYFSEVREFFNSSIELISADSLLIANKLLKKNKEGIEKLSGLMPNDLNSEEVDQLIETYPFVPMHLHLFLKVLASMRKLLKVEKKPNSDERELVNLLNNLLPKNVELELGQLLTFDMFFDSIQNYFDNHIWEYINEIENDTNFEKIDVALMKSLIMTRYVPGFDATEESLCLLLKSSFNINPYFTLQVNESLHKLTKEGHVKKVGNQYRSVIHYGLLQRLSGEKKS